MNAVFRGFLAILVSVLTLVTFGSGIAAAAGEADAVNPWGAAICLLLCVLILTVDFARESIVAAIQDKL